MKAFGVKMNILFAILGSVCLLYFAAVLLVGMDFSIVWLAGAVFFWGIFLVRHMVTLRAIVIPKEIRIFLHLLFGVGGLVFVAAECLIISGMAAKPSGELDCLIVLGAQVRGENPSRALAMRLDKTAEIWEECGEPVLLLSGGKGDGENISEAECMHRVLAAKGIPEEKMILEDASTTTLENLQFCAELTDCKEKRTGVVTNNFHVYRATLLAKKMGYQKVCGVAAKSDWRYQLHYMVREAFALIKEKLNGHV